MVITLPVQCSSMIVSENRYTFSSMMLISGMPDAKRNYRVPTGIYATGRSLPPSNAESQNARDSGLVHAVFNVEPAVVAGQSLGLHLLAASLQLGLIGAPLRPHVLQLLHRQLHLRGLGIGCRRRGRGLRRRDVKVARDEQHGSKKNKINDTKHHHPPGLILELII